MSEAGDVPPIPGLDATLTQPTDVTLLTCGGHTHQGPATDKGNQDFQFAHVHQAHDGSAWAIFGVADGVSGGAWARRGAEHISYAFIEAVVELLASTDAPTTEETFQANDWFLRIAESMHRRHAVRVEADLRRVLEARCLDATYAPAYYREIFFGPNGEQKARDSFFQSTLIGCALGPVGAICLSIGDGYGRVVRERDGQPLEVTALIDATAPATMGLELAEVRRGLMRVGRKESRRMHLLVATDGVSNSSREGLEEAFAGMARLNVPPNASPLDAFAPSSSDDCRIALDRLAAMPQPRADQDNMSIAYGAREFG